jgi:hypothetical protein
MYNQTMPNETAGVCQKKQQQRKAPDDQSEIMSAMPEMDMYRAEAS